MSGVLIDISEVYRFPADPERRLRWVAAISRKDWTPNEHSWICSTHFIKGVKSNDPTCPDYVPSIFHHTGSPIKSWMLYGTVWEEEGDGNVLPEYRKQQEASDVLLLQTPVPLADDEHEEQNNGEDVQALSVMTDMSNKLFTSSKIKYSTSFLFWKSDVCI